MIKEQFGVYEVEPSHGPTKNGLILGPYETLIEAQSASIKYGYSGINYYVNSINNEKYHQIIDEVYKNYVIEDVRILPNMSNEKMTELGLGLSRVEFINKCKTDTELSKGLKIEERELSLEERSRYVKSNHFEVSLNTIGFDEDSTLHKHLDELNIPTKLLTITYNSETIEFYE
jgi:hypothetical protein